MARLQKRNRYLLYSHIASGIQDDGSVLNTVDMSQAKGSEGGLCLLALGVVLDGTRYPLPITTGMALVNSFLIGGDFVTLEDVVLHGLNLSSDFGLDVCLKTKATISDTKLGFLSVDCLPLSGVSEENPFRTALGAVLYAVLLEGHLDESGIQFFFRCDGVGLMSLLWMRHELGLIQGLTREGAKGGGGTGDWGRGVKRTGDG